MATTLTAQRTFSLFTDVDGDNQTDPGDVILVKIRIANTGAEDATNLSVTDSLVGLHGVTNIEITPIALNDSFNITGNTPITLTFAQLLGNDIDPDGAEANLTITNFSGATNGAFVVDNIGHTVTFTPTTGLDVGQSAGFNYTITDEQGRASVAGSEGHVTLNIIDVVWYVDNNAAGGGDGSYVSPFQQLTQLNGLTGDGTTGDDVDSAGETIFVYHNSVTAYTAGITLEAGQKLYGDGNPYMANGHNIGGTEKTGGVDNVATNSVINNAGANGGITLSTDNVIKGIDVNGTALGAVGIQDGGVAVSTGANELLISNVNLTGQGQIIDIDQGGKLNVTLSSAASTGSNNAGGGVIDLTGVTGTFAVTGATSITGTHSQTGIDISGNTAALTTNFAAVTVSGATTGINIVSNTGGLTASFTGNLSVTGTGTQVGVNITNNTGTNGITFSGGTKTVGTADGTAVNLAVNTTATTVSFTNGGLAITGSGTGDGLSVTGTTISVSGSGNTITTNTGQIIVADTASVGAGNITFATLKSTGTVAGNAIDINNLDGGTFTVTGDGTAAVDTSIANSNADAINIRGGSSTVFSFQGTTDIDAATGDGVELNGANGAVTFADLTIDAVGGHGIQIVGATSSVTVSAGAIGVANDAAGDALNMSGSSSATISIAATLEKDTGSAGGNLVEITGRTGGTVTVSGTLTAATDDGASNNNAGIYVHDNTGGTVNFSGGTQTLNTAANAAILLATNTNATVNFTGANLNVDTTTGTGLSASGGGTLTIQGANNSINSTTATAVNINGVTIGALGATFHDISSTNSTVGISLVNTGASGFFHVTGGSSTAQGGDNSGGTIDNITGADGTTNDDGASNGIGIGVYLKNTNDVTLDRMHISDTSNFGVVVEGGSDFVMRWSRIDGSNGDSQAQDEGSLHMLDVGGLSLIDKNDISGGLEDNINIQGNVSNNAVLISNNNIHENHATLGNQGILIDVEGGVDVAYYITNNTFSHNRADSINVGASGGSGSSTALVDVVITGNHFDGERGGPTGDLGGGVKVQTANFDGHLRYDISTNTFQPTAGNVGVIAGGAINVDADSASSLGVTSTLVEGRINGNIIGTSGQAFSGTANAVLAIFIQQHNQGTHTTLITNNIIKQYGGTGIGLQVGGLNLAGGTFNATVTGNTINEDAGADGNGINGTFGTNSTNSETINLEISGNSIAGSGTNGAIGQEDFRLRQRFLTDVNLKGYTGVVSDTAAVVAYVQGQNTGAETGSATVLNSPPHGFHNTAGPGGAVPQPNLPPASPPPPNPIMLAPSPDPALVTPGQGGEDREPVTDGSGDPPTGDPGTQPGGSTPPDTTPTPPFVADASVLTQVELSRIVEAAIQRWIEAGVSPEQIAAMRAITVSVTDMSGVYIGSSSTGEIRIDEDGAGYGWFVDSTPGEDSEFGGTGTRLTADAGGPADHRIDLLTVVMHELGHQIGLGDSYFVSDAAELMYGYIYAGERRLPAAGDADGGVPGSLNGQDYVLGPITDITLLPSGKTVDVFFRATVDSFSDQFIPNPFNNTSTVSGTNFSTVQSAINAMTIDSLTLGNTIFLDANLNSMFDAGEGVVGVALELYADTNNSGGWDAGDTLLGNTTTIANGAYSFSGLAEGDYIVLVKASNFNSGQPLFDRLIIPGVAADPDDNVDNDNNGVAATGGAFASQTITLAYNTEPTPGTGNDTNNTLDIGFVANQPPVANDDSVSVAEDSGANDLTSQLLSNDTDPENDTRTITSATQGTHGTTSVVAGVLTYTPAGNYNGSDSFTYTINDGHGHTDTATVNVTVSAANDPVTGTAPPTASLNEDATNVAITGMSISDVDATLAPAGVYDVTLSSTHGTMTLTTITGLTFGTGDGTGDTTMTFHGTLAAINTALGTAKYTPAANYNGSAQIDLLVTDTFGGTVATGSGLATNDSDSIAVTVNSVNDEPVGADNSAAPAEGHTYTFLTADFSTGFSDPNDSPANIFAGVKITTLPGGTAGIIKLNGAAINAGDVITKTQLDNGNLTFEPAVGSGSLPPATFTFQVQDNGGTALGGVNFDQSANTFTLNIAGLNSDPVLDLDADNSTAPGSGSASSYTEGGAAAAIGDTDVSITDADPGDDIVSATITITNAETGDKLNVGALPGTVTVDGSSTDTTVLLVAAPGTSAADFEAAIEAVTYSSTSDDPTDHGTNLTRSITVVVNDGSDPSNIATASVSVTDVNDAPTGADSTITAVEDTFRVLGLSDLGFNDVDGTFAAVTISAVSGGGIYFDADGTAGAGVPVLDTLPNTYTAADLAAGKVSFKAGPDSNGASLGTITFTVTDDDGADDAVANTLTVDVTAVNDSPALTTGGPIAATEQTVVAILTGASVADVDLDARNGGNGDYAGASFSVNRNPATNAEDLFTLVAGPNFTKDGNDLKAGGQIFATISVDGSAGLLVINFTSLETTATSALVDEVIQSVRYTNTGDNPPASLDLAIGFSDGSPGGGQGSGATNLDVNLVTVNIAGVNDAPVNSLGGTIGTGEDAIDAWLSGMSISDPDANPATDDIVVTFDVDHGTLGIRTDVVGGIVLGDITAQDADTITVKATLDEINATLAASNGLTYSPDLNYNGDDTLTVTTNDQGKNGSDPGLTGDGSSEEDIDLRTISVSAIDDAPVPQPDAVSTPENAIGTGSLFANNGSGPDSDVEGDPFTITEVNGSAANVGATITLASGAKLTVLADGSYSYDPNGKFNQLTDGTSGAVNTSAIGDTFQYTLSGGNTATVTVTVNGVASLDDRLDGDGTNNIITGTPNPDYFYLVQGGEDDVSGLASDDFFFFGAALSNGDKVNGGTGSDQIGIQGNYNLTLGTGIVSVESLVLLPGDVTKFGDPGTNFYDYNLTTVDENVAAGQRLTIDANRLRVGEDFTFDGSAETNGNFFIVGGHGVDTLTGGSQSDTFLFGEAGQWGASDVVDGGTGLNDQLALRGDYTITFGVGQLVNIDSIACVSAFDTRFGALGADFDYNLTMNDDNVDAGQLMTIDGALLRSNETLTFNGAAETNGNYRVAGGDGNDTFTGGAGNDILIGRGGGDTLTGGAGNDQFRYDKNTDSTAAAKDTIQDFTLGDVIDLSRMDANSNTALNDAFTFIGTGAFTSVAGQLRFESAGGTQWLVQGDTDGNGVADFELLVNVTDANPITSSDFIL